jgi:glutamate---cysteine ligase / carboxylate-amine ligase
MSQPDRSLFACFGVELEYMVVRDDSLAAVPWSDHVLVGPNGQPVSDIDRGLLTWSNELTAHVIELKTTDPVGGFDGLSEAFAEEVREVNRRLAKDGARLLPTAMHPWMAPEESKLWSHEFNEVYQAFDRIFDCRGHGWSNVQSVHLNLPFSSDEEFGRLHAAIRLVLPLLPALAASSPIVQGKLTGLQDNRLAFYRSNSAKIPRLCGGVIPEPVFTEADYDREIFQPILRDLAPHDPDGVLEAEFSNSRGAIARFSRQSIEIRLLDIQECPAADLAILRVVVALLRELVLEARLSLDNQRRASVAALGPVFHACVEQGDATVVSEPVLLRAFGWEGASHPTAHQLWGCAISRLDPAHGASEREQLALKTYLREGTLARRMTAMLERDDGLAGQKKLFRRLVRCLDENRPYSVDEVA